ncbi:N-acetyltransferase GCN5 [Dyella thiooxydans]|uniref:N-acetyltransferase GCN5 n=1 Tax=Dyella thiooxydans TaxID=445710 RepID=A0A161J333_9GAMM|nr:GNAT family N-acetyltransferase [Dyella thiooxydans]AND70645.1 N-acetyltransferase GCN5 [Dyella thiooxydans]
MKRPTLQAPKPLTEAHRLEGFRCTESALDSWLKQRARRNQQDGASRCYVVCADDDVVGYYALAAGAVSHAQVPGSVRRNMPEPIPVVVLGRLAVHADWAGQGIGAGLLKDAVLRALRLSQELGIRALLCHALHEDAKRFYLHHGFVESPIEPLTVMLNLAKLQSIE